MYKLKKNTFEFLTLRWTQW